MAWDEMAKFPAYHPQSHVPIACIHCGPLDFILFIFFVNAKKLLRVRFIGRRILFGAFMAKDS